MRMPWWIVWLLSGCWLLFGSLAQAAEVKLLVAEGPYYTAVPIDVQVVAEDFEESPQPTIQATPPQRGQLEFAGIQPSVSSSIQIINGRMSQWKSVRFNFNYRFLAEKSGSYTLGPFTVTQGGVQATTKTVTLTVGEVPIGGEQRLQLVIPPGPFFIGQHVPIRLEWWIHTDLLERLVRQEATVPLFQMLEAFRFEDEEEQEGRNAIVIHAPNGPMKFPATTKRTTWKGDPYLVLTVARTLVPMKSGEHRVAPATIVLEEGVHWQRTFFGQRAATQVRKLRIQDQERTLVVRPLPTDGRPPSFAGAIGHGFTLDVSAPRTVLQAGDPMPLTLTLRGENGALATAALPPLAAGGGLSPRDFRVPEGDIAGVIQEGAKRFEVTVRVLQAGVKEFPPLAYSWFDPEQGTYQTTHSQPIALSVGAAQVVSAGDVVRSQNTEPEPPQPGTQKSGESAASAAAATSSAKALPDANNAAVSAMGQSSPFSLVGADLAIERDPERVLGGYGSVLGSTLVQIVCYLLGMSLVGLAVWQRRGVALDPNVAARRARLKHQLVKLEGAVTITDIAAALRQMAAVTPNVPRQELDVLLEACDNVTFAPGGQQVGLDKGLQERAIQLVRLAMEAKC